MNQTGFIIFGAFVLLIWGVALVFRLCAGSKSESAVSDAKTCLQSYETYTARVQALNGIFRSILNGTASPQDRRKLRAYADEYVALSREYGKRREELRKQLSNADKALEDLRLAQNVTGGANDLGAIPYYVRAHSFNNLVHRINSEPADGPFDAELFRSICQYMKHQSAAA